MRVEFLGIERNGPDVSDGYVITYSEDNSPPKTVAVPALIGNLVFSARVDGANEVRRVLNGALTIRRLDGRIPV